ncbi:enoyl-CoA hydratase-related protein [Caballeronia sp. LZ001]|uniref:enoyl-CoA hydratase/isomerase family protein n=1 Tax=Caballeronia sp. LZ001 TaxID=3038553 RepID=UPI0028562660|nr:enoyl-CoA hydratase-related protein [Caballeronia sp. LZ001]MDR5804870.1 enoyl-CoA hydratase-related protein [Caballeronia sp. LZ001]
MSTDSESPTILYTEHEQVALLTLNRPDRLNAFTTPMVQLWAALLERAESDPNIRAVIITGAGRAFCSGGDTQEMGTSDSNTPLAIKRRLTDGVQRIPLQLERMAKPVIAAVNGLAVGAGMDLALMCDVRFAAESAKMAETYARIGLVPGAGGAWFLPRLVGTAKALELFWSAESIEAPEALRLGLVNKVCPDDELLDQTMSFARRVASAPPLAVQLIKRTVYESGRLELKASLDLVSSHMTIVRNSEDHAEALSALREKRPGIYHGK